MLKRAIQSLLLLGIFFLTPYVIANGGTEVTLSLNKETININESVNLTVAYKIQGGANIGTIVIPGLENFDILGKSNSTSMSIVNGSASSILNIDLTLQAKREGEFTLGPVSIDHSGTIYRSNAVKVRVSGKKMFLQPQNPNVFTPIPKTQEEIESIEDIERKPFKKPTYTGLYLFFSLVIFVIAFLAYQYFGTPSMPDQNISEVSTPQVKLPNIDDEDFFDVIEKYLFTYIHNQFSFDPFTMTHGEIILKLSSLKINTIGDEQLAHFKDILKLLENKKYAGKTIEKDKLLSTLKNITS